MVLDKRILVTGAGGFIGSHLVEALLSRGARVSAMVRYNSSSSIGNLDFLDESSKKKLTVVSGNIEDSDFVFRAMEGQDIVFHLAALIAIPYSYVAPRSYIRTNVEGTLNVMEAARRLRIPRVVHTSTSEVYGTAKHVPIAEDHPLQGQSPYSASKIGADMVADSYYRSFETPVVTLRPFNTFGPRQSARAFIPTIISQALGPSNQINLGLLTPHRDMTFVSDTVEGFILAGTVAGIEGETINLGTGESHSIGDFAQRLLRLMRSSKEIARDKNRERPVKSEVMQLRSNNQKARRLLGWQPRTMLDDGLVETITFVTKYAHIYRSDMYTV